MAKGLIPFLLRLTSYDTFSLNKIIWYLPVSSHSCQNYPLLCRIKLCCNNDFVLYRIETFHWVFLCILCITIDMAAFLVSPLFRLLISVQNNKCPFIIYSTSHSLVWYWGFHLAWYWAFFRGFTFFYVLLNFMFVWFFHITLTKGHHWKCQSVFPIMSFGSSVMIMYQIVKDVSGNKRINEIVFTMLLKWNLTTIAQFCSKEKWISIKNSICLTWFLRKNFRVGRKTNQVIGIKKRELTIE